MASEIERKYLVHGESWRVGRPGMPIKQGYLNEEKVLRTVRVRIQGDEAFLTVKGRSVGAMRSEWEYSIPVADAEQMLEEVAVPTPIEKFRYIRVIDGVEWFIDDYLGANKGLITAEANGPGDVDENWHPPSLPDWAGADITGVSRYFNNRLAENPYMNWPARHKTHSDGTVEEAIRDAT